MMRESLFLAGGIAAIGLASILTYGLRLGGLLLAEHLPATGPARRFLDALPGAILVSLVVPEALHARVPGMIGLTACLLVYWKSRNLLATMVAGVVAVALCR
jgi:uncharacterized membrane protein